MYLDSNGLIEQSNGDGGDKLQRTVFWWTGMHYNCDTQPFIPGMANYETSLDILTGPSGNLERDEIKWTEVLDPNDVSRDQLTPNVHCMGLYGMKDRLKLLLKGIILNLSQYNNGDVATLIDYGRFVRAFRAWYLSPILYIFDAQLFFASIFIAIQSQFDKKNDYVGNYLNHISDLTQARHIYPTLFLFLVRKIFKLRRGGPMYGMKIYFDPSTGADPEFIDLWKPIVEDF